MRPSIWSADGNEVDPQGPNEGLDDIDVSLGLTAVRCEGQIYVPQSTLAPCPWRDEQTFFGYAKEQYPRQTWCPAHA